MEEEAEEYLTLLEPCEGCYKEKMSRFLAFIIPVKSLEEVKEQLEFFRNKYHDARHVCYAYMLGSQRKDFRINDDGEPSGTAGKPILGQLNSFHLTNVVAIVVRYFGGIKLGTGGLTSAYKEAVSLALQGAKIIKKQVTKELSIEFPYSIFNLVMRSVKQYEAEIRSRDMEETCRFLLSIPIKNYSTLLSALQDMGCKTKI